MTVNDNTLLKGKASYVALECREFLVAAVSASGCNVVMSTKA